MPEIGHMKNVEKKKNQWNYKRASSALYIEVQVLL